LPASSEKIARDPKTFFIFWFFATVHTGANVGAGQKSKKKDLFLLN